MASDDLEHKARSLVEKFASSLHFKNVESMKITMKALENMHQEMECSECDSWKYGALLNEENGDVGSLCNSISHLKISPNNSKSDIACSRTKESRRKSRKSVCVTPRYLSLSESSEEEEILEVKDDDVRVSLQYSDDDMDSVKEKEKRKSLYTTEKYDNKDGVALHYSSVGEGHTSLSKHNVDNVLHENINDIRVALHFSSDDEGHMNVIKRKKKRKSVCVRKQVISSNSEATDSDDSKIPFKDNIRYSGDEEGNSSSSNINAHDVLLHDNKRDIGVALHLSDDDEKLMNVIKRKKKRKSVCVRKQVISSESDDTDSDDSKIPFKDTIHYSGDEEGNSSSSNINASDRVGNVSSSNINQNEMLDDRYDDIGAACHYTSDEEVVFRYSSDEKVHIRSSKVNADDTLNDEDDDVGVVIRYSSDEKVHIPSSKVNADDTLNDEDDDVGVVIRYSSDEKEHIPSSKVNTDDSLNDEDDDVGVAIRYSSDEKGHIPSSKVNTDDSLNDEDDDVGVAIRYSSDEKGHIPSSKVNADDSLNDEDDDVGVAIRYSSDEEGYVLSSNLNANEIMDVKNDDEVGITLYHNVLTPDVCADKIFDDEDGVSSVSLHVSSDDEGHASPSKLDVDEMLDDNKNDIGLALHLSSDDEGQMNVVKRKKKRKSVCVKKQVIISSESEVSDSDDSENNDIPNGEHLVEDVVLVSNSDDENSEHGRKQNLIVSSSDDDDDVQQVSIVADSENGSPVFASTFINNDEEKNSDGCIQGVSTVASSVFVESSEEDEEKNRNKSFNSDGDGSDENNYNMYVNSVKKIVISSEDESDESDDFIVEDVEVKKTPRRKNVYPERNMTTFVTPKSATKAILDRLKTPKSVPGTPAYKRYFNKVRSEVVQDLFKLFNRTIFDGKLPDDFKITWNKRMTKTAGFCFYSKSMGIRNSRIELSDKVIDCTERVRDTLIHEMCHAATWIIDGKSAGHGPAWKYWAKKANRVHPDLPVISRCHQYEIHTKFNYKCNGCGQIIGRHSKSIDPSRHRCSRCGGIPELIQSNPSTSTTPRTPNRYAMFVKDNFASVKKANIGFSHKEIMVKISEKFKEFKLTEENKENK